MRHQCTAVVALASLLFAACGGGDTTGPATPNDATTMSARIDGAAWSAISVAIDSTPPSVLFLTGVNASQTLTLGIPVNQGVGLQAVGGPTPVAAVLVNGEQWWAASRTQGGAGSITLTSVAPGHVAGTFEFTLNGRDVLARRVTSGKFDVRY